MGESKSHKQARQIELQNAQLQQQIEKQNLELQRQAYGQISPFATNLLGMGQNAMKGQAPDFFQLGTRNAIASAFGGERQNLADFLGQSGQGFGGLAAGPAANLGAQESTAIGQAQADAIQQALGMGLQGGNLLAGQQAIFNPSQYGAMAGQGFQNYLQATPYRSGFGNFLGSIGGAALSAIPFGNLFSKIPGFGKPTSG